MTSQDANRQPVTQRKRRWVPCLMAARVGLVRAAGVPKVAVVLPSQATPAQDAKPAQRDAERLG